MVALRLAKPVGDLTKRRCAHRPQGRECVVVNQVLGVAERGDKVGDCRGGRLAKRCKAGHAARAYLRKLVGVGPALDILPLEQRHRVDHAYQRSFPDWVGVAQRPPQPRHGVGPQPGYGLLCGVTSGRVGRHQQILHPVLQRPTIDQRPAVALGDDDEQPNDHQQAKADFQEPPFRHGQQSGSPGVLREEKKRVWPSDLPSNGPVGKLSQWTQRTRQQNGAPRFCSGF